MGECTFPCKLLFLTKWFPPKKGYEYLDLVSYWVKSLKGVIVIKYPTSKYVLSPSNGLLIKIALSTAIMSSKIGQKIM